MRRIFAAHLLAIGIVLAACSAEEAPQIREESGMGDMEYFVAAAMAAPDSRSSLIIELVGTRDEVYLSIDRERIRFILPQSTGRQRAVGPRMRAIADELGIELRGRRDGSNSRFLVAELRGSAEQVSEFTRQLLRAYGADERTRLNYTCRSCQLQS
jgi:hypothetical protein